MNWKYYSKTKGIEAFRICICWLMVSFCVFFSPYDGNSEINCTGKLNPAEVLICTDPELQALDKDLNNTYQSVMQMHSAASALKTEQLKWLEKRNHCVQKDCLVKLYLERITALKKSDNAERKLIYSNSLSDTEDKGVFTYKDLKDFKNLDDFKTIQEFETYIDEYVQNCLDNTWGGTGGIPCFDVRPNLWIREMEIVYNRLNKILNSDEKIKLEQSQKAWSHYRDSIVNLNSDCLDKVYSNREGTRFALMRVGDEEKILTFLIENRVLILRTLLERNLRKIEN